MQGRDGALAAQPQAWVLRHQHGLLLGIWHLAALCKPQDCGCKLTDAPVLSASPARRLTNPEAGAQRVTARRRLACADRLQGELAPRAVHAKAAGPLLTAVQRCTFLAGPHDARKAAHSWHASMSHTPGTHLQAQRAHQAACPSPA